MKTKGGQNMQEDLSNNVKRPSDNAKGANQQHKM
jgi:hypothetical protein